MFADPRSKALVTNFAFQWLSVRGLDAVEPDPHLYPSFDEDLRQAFVEEMDAVSRQHPARQAARASSELLTAPYTFVNERLARTTVSAACAATAFAESSSADPQPLGRVRQG